MKAYKGFDVDWKCLGFQFEVGKTYVHDGEVKLCSSGFHACEYPLDVFGYYPPTGRLAEVEVDGVCSEQGGDTKVAAKTITVKASLTIPELVSAAIEYTTSRCDSRKTKHSTGYKSASSATGDYSASSATGNRSASSATGYKSASSATGDYSASSATGDRSASSATGDRSASSATGDQSASSATGYHAVAAAFGLNSKAKAGETGIVVVAWWDEKLNRKRLAVGYVGEDGIEQDTWYWCDAEGNLKRVDS